MEDWGMGRRLTNHLLFRSGRQPIGLEISAGDYHTVALKTDGTLWAWGYNYYGGLGDGTTVYKSSPVQIGTATDWAQISAGTYHTVALKTDETFWAWGYNDFGQLGDGTTGYRDHLAQTGTVDGLGCDCSRRLSHGCPEDGWDALGLGI